jgi:hypothetical protein
MDRDPVDVAAGHLDAAGDLLFQQLEVRLLHQPGRDAEMGEGQELGARVGGVAVALHHRQVLVVAVGAQERAALDAPRNMAQLEENQVRSRWLRWAESRCRK